MSTHTFTEHDFRPVILGGDITAYSLVRTFHEAYAVKSLVVNMTETGPIAMSGLCDHIYEAGLENEANLIEALSKVGAQEGAAKGKKLILLAAGDWYVRLIIENRALLEQWFVIPYIGEDLMNEIVLKDKFYGYLDTLDLPYPKTVVVDVPNGEDVEVPAEWGFPIVAKPASSALYHYAKFPGKKKVYILHSKAELDEMLVNLRTSSYDYKFLVQEFVPGNDTNMRVLTCYSDKNGKVVFGSLGHVLLEEHVPMAIGNPCVIINTEDDEIINQAKAFLEHVGYVGYSNFDLKFDPRDGTYKFFEINVRLGRSNYYVTAGGNNTAEYYVRDHVYGEDFEGVTYARGEHLFAFVPKYVIKKYVLDKPLRDKALGLMKAGKASDPNSYKPDLTPKRRAYNLAYHLNQIRKFRKHFVAR